MQRHRTRTYRRVKKKTPGRKLIIQYTKRKPSKAKCAQCKKLLKGVPRDLPYKIRKLSKTQKRPERPFGGYLCSECMRKEIRKRFNISKQAPFEQGQICIKLAGKEAGKICVVIEKLDKNFVAIDGQTKRKRCNIMHLAPLEQKIKISKKSTQSDIAKELKKLNIDIQEKKAKQKATEKSKHALLVNRAQLKPRKKRKSSNLKNLKTSQPLHDTAKEKKAKKEGENNDKQKK